MKVGNGNPIIVVDDDELDIRLVKRHCARSNLENELLSFTSGNEFLSYLSEIEEVADEMPALVLLDINMPIISGFDVLKRTRERNAFKILPIFFMFTCSDDPQEREKALELGANGFCSKETSFNDSQEFVEWLDQKLNEVSGMA